MSLAFDTDTVASVHRIPVGSLRSVEGIRSDGLSESHIALLMETSEGWPPIIVWGDERMIVDGAHRAEAARRLGLHFIPAVFFYGSREEAFVESVRRNVDHGLPLSVTDRRRAAGRVLDRHPEWSDRRIASVCGLSGKTVARMRQDAPSLARQIDGVVIGIDRRIGRDGKERPVHTGEVRDRIRRALAEHPDGSLRTIAAIAGASPETVRSVRIRLAEEPFHPEDCPAADDPIADDGGRPILAMTTTVMPATVEEAEEPQSASPKWSSDPALLTCENGSEFAQWFDATRVEEEWHRFVLTVPLGRVYDIVDEARRRAAAWTSFASILECRTH